MNKEHRSARYYRLEKEQYNNDVSLIKSLIAAQDYEAAKQHAHKCYRRCENARSSRCKIYANIAKTGEFKYSGYYKYPRFIFSEFQSQIDSVSKQ